MKISENFSLSEFTNSDTANKHGVDNTPNDEQIENIKQLVINILQPVRDLHGKPITINSGFRCERLNFLVGSKNTSQHLKGEAADITAGSKAENKKLFDLIAKSGLKYDQLIDENKYQWIHISHRKNNNRQQILHL